MTTKMVGAAAIILNENGHILLVKHNYGKFNWEIPGGLSEAYESAEESCIREVAEETGLNGMIERLTGVYYEQKYDMHHFVFSCKIENHQEALADMQEVIQCGYFDIENLPRPISDFTIMRILDATQQNNATAFKTISERIWYE